jgi:hypothetical protein
LIDEAISKGWREIDVKADSVLSRAIWFEGEMRGVSVRGYQPTSREVSELASMRQKGVLPQRVLSSTVGRYYEQRVIPELERRIEKETIQLSSDSLLTPKARVEAMDRVEVLRETLGRSRILENQFRQDGPKSIQVKAVYLDGLLRYEPAREKRRDLER